MIRSPLASAFVLTPNIGVRRDGRRPDMIVLHYTGMADAARAVAWLCDPASGVSCHYLVDAGGGIVQMVGEEMRAWHCGVSSWQGESDSNSRSIGIEIDNPGHHLGYREFPGVQMAAVIALCRDILARHAIPARNVVAHSDIAPGRKIDPGEKFDWGALHRQGIGHWAAPAELSDGPSLRRGDSGSAVAELQAGLAGHGYGIAASGDYDAATETVVAAFQRHFRPARVDGVADFSTRETLRRLALRHPDEAGRVSCGRGQASR